MALFWRHRCSRLSNVEADIVGVLCTYVLRFLLFFIYSCLFKFLHSSTSFFLLYCAPSLAYNVFTDVDVGVSDCRIPITADWCSRPIRFWESCSPVRHNSSPKVSSPLIAPDPSTLVNVSRPITAILPKPAPGHTSITQGRLRHQTLRRGCMVRLHPRRLRHSKPHLRRRRPSQLHGHRSIVRQVQGGWCPVVARSCERPAARSSSFRLCGSRSGASVGLHVRDRDPVIVPRSAFCWAWALGLVLIGGDSQIEHEI